MNRKQLDPKGEKTLFVVERRFADDSWGIAEALGGMTSPFASDYKGSVEAKKKIIQEHKCFSSWWTSRKFRVRLYARVED